MPFITKEELLARINNLETKIMIYSERDWLITQTYIEEVKRLDSILLDIYTEDNKCTA